MAITELYFVLMISCSGFLNNLKCYEATLVLTQTFSSLLGKEHTAEEIWATV